MFREKESPLPPERISRSELEQYRLNTEYFKKFSVKERVQHLLNKDKSIRRNGFNPDSFFHPTDHLARTLIWVDPIVNLLPQEQRDDIDKRVLRIAAVLHDTGRGGFHRNKHTHGGIGAELIRDQKELAKILPHANTQTLTDEQVENIAYLVENHHEFDHDKAKIRPEMRTSLDVLQTADGLDLTRGNYALGGPISAVTERTDRIDNALPVVGHTLRIPEAKKLRTTASRLATYTQKAIKFSFGGKDRFTTCLDIAQGMAIIKD
jgi:hypothetical protein